MACDQSEDTQHERVMPTSYSPPPGLFIASWSAVALDDIMLLVSSHESSLETKSTARFGMIIIVSMLSITMSDARL